MSIQPGSDMRTVAQLSFSAPIAPDARPSARRAPATDVATRLMFPSVLWASDGFRPLMLGRANGREARHALEVVEVDAVAHVAPARIFERLMVPRVLLAHLHGLGEEEPPALARQHIRVE